MKKVHCIISMVDLRIESAACYNPLSGQFEQARYRYMYLLWGEIEIFLLYLILHEIYLELSHA